MPSKESDRKEGNRSGFEKTLLLPVMLQKRALLLFGTLSIQIHPHPQPSPYISEFNISEFTAEQTAPSITIHPSQHGEPALISTCCFSRDESWGSDPMPPPCPLHTPRPCQGEAFSFRAGFRVLPREATQKLTSHLPWRLSTPN